MTGLRVWLHPSSRTVNPVAGRQSLVVGSNPRPTKLCPGNALKIAVLYAASFGRAAAIVRNRRKVLDRPDFDSRRCQGANCRLASGTRTADADVDRPHAVIARHVGGVHRGLLGSERGSLARSAKAERTRTLPGNHVTRHIGNGHNRVV